jgi:hypothetical protein
MMADVTATRLPQMPIDISKFPDAASVLQTLQCHYVHDETDIRVLLKHGIKLARNAQMLCDLVSSSHLFDQRDTQLIIDLIERANHMRKTQFRIR